MSRFSKLSIKWRLFCLLTIVPVVVLSLYLTLTTRSFRSDKLAYVLQSSSSLSRSLAAEVHSRLEAYRTFIQPMLEGYNARNQDFDGISRKLFDKDPNLRFLQVLTPNGQGGLAAAGSLGKSGGATLEEWRGRALELGARLTPGDASHDPASAGNVVVDFLDVAAPASTLLWIAEPMGPEDEPNRSVVVSARQVESFMGELDSAGVFSNFLIDRGARRILSRSDSARRNLSKESVQELLGLLFTNSSARGTRTVRLMAPGAADRKEGRDFLASYAPVGTGSLVIVSVVSADRAFAAVRALLTQSILFFIALISITTLISVIASSRLTASLRELHQATRRVAQGEFEFEVSASSEDEVGDLARGFNTMALEVSKLMREMVEKGRMENELETARLVQNTLFPPDVAQLGPIDVAGWYQPASECGGDWWFYNEIDGKHCFWIGDVTGHGVPSALLTGVARATVAAIEDFALLNPGLLGPAQMMALLNRGIHKTSKGAQTMTFFLASLDSITGELCYVNACHNPPYLARADGNSEGDSDVVLEALNGNRNTVLGEDPEVEFEETWTQLLPGERIIFYTDGVSDIEDPSGRMLGRRRMMERFRNSLNGSPDVVATVATLKADLIQFQGTRPRSDDVTFFVVQYHGSEALSEAA